MEKFWTRASDMAGAPSVLGGWLDPPRPRTGGCRRGGAAGVVGDLGGQAGTGERTATAWSRSTPRRVAAGLALGFPTGHGTVCSCRLESDRAHVLEAQVGQPRAVLGGCVVA